MAAAAYEDIPAPSTDVTDSGASAGQRAAERATDQNSLRVTAPLIGTVDLPPTEQLAYFGGLGLLAAVGMLEWPVALTLVAGHLLASGRGNKTLRDFGRALEEA